MHTPALLLVYGLQFTDYAIRRLYDYAINFLVP